MESKSNRSLNRSANVSETGWNLAELRAYARNNEAHLAAVLPLLSSIGRSFEIFEFHKESARDALVGIVNADAPSLRAYFELIFGMSEKTEQFAAAKLASEAHVIGALHSTRSLVEQLAQLANALLINPPRSIHACSAQRVSAWLPKSVFKDLFDSLLESKEFKYVEAFVNTTKHRRLIAHGMTVSFTENQVGARFADFEYDARTFEAHWAHEVLELAVEIVSALVACGRALNREAIDANPLVEWTHNGIAPRCAQGHDAYRGTMPLRPNHSEL